MMGVLFSQPLLFAIWATLAHQRFYSRFLWSLLLCTLVSFGEELVALRDADHRDTGTLMLLDFTLFLTVTIILSVVRRFSRWQIKQPDTTDAASVYQTYHFGIKHLLILTTITALGCGLFRTLYTMSPKMTFFPSITQFVAVTCACLAMLFPVIIIPWYTLAYRRKLRSLVILTVIMGGVLDLAACYLIMDIDHVPPGASSYELIIKPLLFFQLGSALSAVTSTLVIRICGFRMVREPKAQVQECPT